MPSHVPAQRVRTYATFCFFLLGTLLFVTSPCEAGEEFFRPRQPRYPHNLINKVQVALHQQGFDPGTVDGEWGPRTQAALIEFQRAESLPETAAPDRNTLSHLFSETRKTILALQALLSTQEFYKGAVDGNFGPETKAALAQYEEAKGIPVTGEFRGETRKVILVELSAEAQDEPQDSECDERC